MAAADRTVYIVRVFNPDGSPYLDTLGKSLARLGAPAATGYGAYSEAQRDQMIATAQDNGYTATWEIAPDWRTT
ncbi:hypothetical protein ACFYUY_01480 [Kitasatospora sp. NPDC004745]|uniref:hypothetical protein n=1 Tax=Kitasatospora sp. NPDC004745 TaxID=3364019 RepID=UPI0036C04456